MTEYSEDTYDADCDQKEYDNAIHWKESEEHFLSVSEGD